MKKVFVLSYLSLLISCLSFGQNVGIGTTTPVSKLHVKGTGSGNQIVLEESTGIMLRISNEATAIGPYIGTTSNHPLTLVSNNSGRMTIATNGNVGIGTTSPQQQLSVAGGAVIDQNNNNIGTSAAMLSFGSSSGEGVGSKRTSGTNQYGLDFYTNNLQRMTVTNGGNMGIGTTTPTQKLEVNGAIKIGTTSTASDGSIRYNTNQFEGYNGTSWTSFDQLPIGTLVSSTTYPDAALENDGFQYKGLLPNIVQQQTTTGVAANTWLQTSTQSVIDPGARYQNSAVWTGTEMIVWGGTTGGITEPGLNTGAKYNADRNIWTKTSTTNAPTARVNNTAIWTGTEMIIWGGTTAGFSGAVLNTGAKYNPLTNIWTPISTTNAPTARTWHTAIWTGTEMIIWGGETNTGAKYNPSTNTWTAISTTNAPAARSNHTAIWTGTDMIIWGGQATSLIYYNTGAKYNPATNTWTAIATTNAPTGRVNHTAIWDGTAMIIWGGYYYDFNLFEVSFNTGGQYNPTTNTWMTITPIPGIDGMTNHKAVWTGSLMLVWGGTNWSNSNYTTYSNIYKYNSFFNTWSETSASSPPANRHLLSSAVWTGNAFIVWGGSGNGNNSLNSGGRFFPSALPSYSTTTEQTGSIYLYGKQ